jgi:hypothetical protein
MALVVAERMAETMVVMAAQIAAVVAACMEVLAQALPVMQHTPEQVQEV